MKNQSDVAIPVGERLRLRINDLAVGGQGVARASDGRVVFVSEGLPGELVEAEVTRALRQYYQARTHSVLEPSEQRAPPACGLYGRCGGCDLMHLDPVAQARAKAAWVVAALQRLGEPPEPEAIPSPRSLGYRNRLRLQVSRARLGFFAAHSRELVEVTHCPVAAPGINRLLPGLAGALRELGEGGLTGVEILAGLAEDSPVFLTLHLPRGARPNRQQREHMQRLAQQAGAAGARLAVGGRAGGWPLDLDHGLVYYPGPPQMWAFPGVFCQANFAVNQGMIQAVTATAGEAGPGAALDLYAGSGNFSFPLALTGRTVVAVESADAALEAARFHQARLGLGREVELLRGDAARTAAALAEQRREFAVVVLDPPRAGAKPTMSALRHLNPRRVIYVSCHPAALARDAGVLTRAGYVMRRLWVADQLPYTGHVESILALDRG